LEFEHTVLTTAPPERIWEAWTDVGRWPEWDTELASASLACLLTRRAVDWRR